MTSSGMESFPQTLPKVDKQANGRHGKERSGHFQMPLRKAGVDSSSQVVPEVEKQSNGQHGRRGHFQMPLHYPRYTRADYETMPEWRLDCLLAEYGLPAFGDVEEKRKFAMGAFLWN